MTEVVPPTISLVVADDHPPFLAAIQEFLSQAPRMRVLAVAVDGVRALSAIRTHSPQVAVLDLEMPGLTGLAIARAVQESGLPTAIVLLTMHKAAHVVRSALDQGITRYLLKEDLGSHLIPAIEAAFEKRSYFSPQLLNATLRQRIAQSS